MHDDWKKGCNTVEKSVNKNFFDSSIAKNNSNSPENGVAKLSVTEDSNKLENEELKADNPGFENNLNTSDCEIEELLEECYQDNIGNIILPAPLKRVTGISRNKIETTVNLTKKLVIRIKQNTYSR